MDAFYGHNGTVTSVFFEGLQFYAYHGVSPEEQVVGHRFSVDLFLSLAKAPVGDDLATTVDYGDAMAYVQEFATARRYKTIEALASDLLDALLKRYPKVSEATIRIAKLAPPAPCVAELAGVEMVRAR